MRIEHGFWLSLTDERKAQIIYQCATDKMTNEEFMELWRLAGTQLLRLLGDTKETSLEFRIRAQKL